MQQRFAKFGFGSLTASLIALAFFYTFISVILNNGHMLSTVLLVVYCVLALLSFFSIVSFLMMAFPKWNYIELDNDGFTVQMGRGKMRFLWQECTRAFAVELPSRIPFKKKWVAAIDLHDPTKLLKATKVMNGAHVPLIKGYGIRYSDLVDIMNEYRDRALSNSKSV